MFQTSGLCCPSAVGWAEAAGPEAGAGAVPLPQIVLWMPSAPTRAASGGIVSSSCRGWGPSVEESDASTSATIASLVYLYCCLFLYIIKSCKMAYSSTVSNANASITIHARMYVCILCIHVCVYAIDLLCKGWSSDVLGSANLDRFDFLMSLQEMWSVSCQIVYTLSHKYMNNDSEFGNDMIWYLYLRFY